VLLEGQRIALRGQFAGIHASGAALIQTDEATRVIAAGELKLRTGGLA
jgi:hypothetical protein